MQAEISQAFNAECSVVFSDISRFSSRVAGKSPDEIKTFLDDYYAHVIPIIYEYGGLVDQMFGDGIISVFSPQLSDRVGANVFQKGLLAAEKIVASFAGNDAYSTKCALHKGDAVVCSIGDNNYRQASLVGEIMTVVHRVESVAKDESVNMLLSIPEAMAEYEKVRGKPSTAQAEWNLDTFDAELKGIGDGKQKILYEEYIRK
jgi:adenylate cyclase